MSHVQFQPQVPQLPYSSAQRIFKNIFVHIFVLECLFQIDIFFHFYLKFNLFSCYALVAFLGTLCSKLSLSFNAFNSTLTLVLSSHTDDILRFRELGYLLKLTKLVSYRARI